MYTVGSFVYHIFGIPKGKTAVVHILLQGCFKIRSLFAAGVGYAATALLYGIGLLFACGYGKCFAACLKFGLSGGNGFFKSTLYPFCFFHSGGKLNFLLNRIISTVSGLISDKAHLFSLILQKGIYMV